MDLRTKVEHSLRKLEDYLQTTGLKGYDPYDALNSKMLSVLSFDRRVLRLVYTQALKRLPVNLRPLLGVQEGYNPKGLGLFLTGYLKLYALYRTKDYLEKTHWIVSLLEEAACDGYSGYCWGYNFDWQGEVALIRAGTPTIVNTVFVAHAFLDAYEVFGEARFFDIARSACDFILRDLYILRCNDSACFSYTPMGPSKIHNANVLGGGFLARVYSVSKEEKLLEYAQKAVAYTAGRQRGNGSWPYGESKKGEGYWTRGDQEMDCRDDDDDSGFVSYVDSYHTGFVLESLFAYTEFTQDRTYVGNIQDGLRFFKDRFFLDDGTPKYYDDRVYPIDIHSAAQAVVTLSKLKKVEDSGRLLQKVVCWMIDRMQDDGGYFYYRKGRLFTNRIPYIRWSQAWAFHALTIFFNDSAFLTGGQDGCRSPYRKR